MSDLGKCERDDTRGDARAAARNDRLVEIDASLGEHALELVGSKLYIGGTIHLLRKEDYPLPDVFEQAYKDSARLVFELPPGSEGDGEVVLRMQQMGTYAEGDDLGQHVCAETLNKVFKWADKNSFPRVVITRMRPWLLAPTMMMSQPRRSAHSTIPSAGVPITISAS